MWEEDALSYPMQRKAEWSILLTNPPILDHLS